MTKQFNNKFQYFIGFSALTIAICSAFFSVYGIGNLFSGASKSAMIMAISLELGKLAATTFLYRYWKKSTKLIKIYLTLSVITLMIITSAGIFGFLSSAYQKSSLEFKLSQEQIVSKESSKGFYINQIKSSEDRIGLLNDVRKVQESRLSEALTNVFLSRNPIQLQQIQEQTIKLIDQSNGDIKDENDKIEQYKNQIQSISEDVDKMKMTSIGKKDIQTFKFLSDALHVDLDTVVKWFILCLICVFDPLAIALILAYNIVLFNRIDNISTDDSKTQVEPIVVPQPNVKENINTEAPIMKELEPIPNENPPVSQPQPVVEADNFFKGMFKQ